MKIRRIGLLLLLCLLFSVAVLYRSDTVVEASEVVLPQEYYFLINGQRRNANTEYEMKSPEVLMNVTSGTWEPATEVQWISSEPGVVTIENTSYGSNFVKLVRKGPGYSQITAVVKQGTNSYSISCSIKVDLMFDYQKTGTTTSTTTNQRILVLDEETSTKKIYLKYVNYTTGDEENPETVTGAAISANMVLWESDNEGVATVDEKGVVTAVGAGSANIKVTTNTMSTQDRALNITLKVVVTPTFTLTYDVGNEQRVVHSADDELTSIVAKGVPANFVIESNADVAQYLKWEVYDFSNGKLIPPTGSSKLTYSTSTLSGNVSFQNVKAGTYEIYAFADKAFNTGTNAPYAYMKIEVPVRVQSTNIIMNVKDTYSILDNTNIPFLEVFKYTVVGNQSVISLEQGVITARREGTVKVVMEYEPDTGIFDEDIGQIELNITVIDGISLSTSSAILYNSGSLQLNAIITDYTVPIVWTSSNSKVATVEGGLVKAIGVGTTTITAKQTIKGVTKWATCQIIVQQSVASITIDPSVLNLGIGNYKTLHATITPANLSGVNLTWKTSHDAIVKIIETSGKTVTIQGVAGGHAVISAINQDNVVVGYCHVNVQQGVTSVVLNESEVSLNLSMKQIQLRATVYPENASNKAVKWTSTDTTKARVSDNGTVTLLKPGSVTIIATSVDNPEATAMCNLNIQIPVVSVALDSEEKTMYVGQSERLSYVVLPMNASNNSVTWTSTNPSAVTVDNTGKVTAKNVGTSVIILKSLDGGFSTFCTITVKRIATGVKFDASELNLKTGEYYFLKTELTPAGSTETELSWESSDTKVATVDDAGKVTAKEAGTAIIMARTEAGGIAYCKVIVTQAVEGLLLNYSEKTVFLGTEFKLKVSISPSDASEKDVIWKSSDPTVASVSDEGVITGLKGGMAVITCTTVDGGYSAVCVITVREEMTRINLNYSEYHLGVGKSVNLVATVTTETATNKKVTWVSSNEEVAFVNKNGKVTGIKLGYATITAIAQDGSEVEASCEIRVVNPVSKITLNESYVSMLVGESHTLKATLQPNNATFKTARWTSSDESVAVVDEDGVVTAFKAGSAIITAQAMDSSGKKAICYVTVRDHVPATGITISDKNITMVVGEEKAVQIAVAPNNSTDSMSWSTDNAAVASVDKRTGRIKARSTGTANITVMSASGKTAVIRVTVVGLNVTELSLEQYTRFTLIVDGAPTAVTWTIDNPKIASVNGGRIITQAVGTATITARVNGAELKCKLKVTKIK